MGLLNILWGNGSENVSLSESYRLKHRNNEQLFYA